MMASREVLYSEYPAQHHCENHFCTNVHGILNSTLICNDLLGFL